MNNHNIGRRVIEFRVWDVEKKKMTHQDNPCNIKGNKFVLMQYSGLKDENGIKIFEGDILEITQYSYKNKEIKKDVNILLWNEEEAKYEFMNSMNNFIHFGGHDFYAFKDSYFSDGGKEFYFKVIGNYFENGNS